MELGRSIRGSASEARLVAVGACVCACARCFCLHRGARRGEEGCCYKYGSDLGGFLPRPPPV